MHNKIVIISVALYTITCSYHATAMDVAPVTVLERTSPPTEPKPLPLSPLEQAFTWCLLHSGNEETNNLPPLLDSIFANNGSVHLPDVRCSRAISHGFYRCPSQAPKKEAPVTVTLSKEDPDTEKPSRPPFMYHYCETVEYTAASYTTMIQRFLDAGICPNIVIHPSLMTPLMCAAQFGSKDGVLLLLARGANARAQDKFGRTARKHAEIAKEWPYATWCATYDEIITLLAAAEAA